MADSKIEWLMGPDGKAGKTWNPLAGCSDHSSNLNRDLAARQMGEALFVKLLAEGRHVVHIQHKVVHTYDPLQGYKPAMQDRFTVDLTKVHVDRITMPMSFPVEEIVTWRPPKVISLWEAAKRFLKAEWDRAGKNPGVPYDGPMPCKYYPGKYEDDDAS